MKITNISLRNYRGIEELNVKVPRKGLVAKGGNAKGKSSLLKAIRSVLEARDIGPDAIRLGTDRAELLVDLDDVSVKRVITAKTSTVAVERAGMKASKPTTYLREMLGTASLDPLEIYLAKPKDRRALILAALPVKVTIEQLRKYAPDIEDTFDTTGHGLEVLERARKFFYDERTLANREADEAKREADRLESEAAALAADVPSGPVVDAPTAQTALALAERERLALESRAAEATRSEARTATQREQIVGLRQDADTIDGGVGEPIETESLEDLVDEASDAVRLLEEQLASSKAALATLQGKLSDAKSSNARHAQAVARAADLRAQANTLAAALASASITPPTDEETQVAKAKVETATRDVERAGCQAKAVAAVEVAEQARGRAASLAAEASALDATVKRLANDAPSELLAATDGIPGLTIEEDEVLLEGVRLDALSGAEQLKFAVEIARRANAKTKILVCDGLERLDSEQLDAFVRHATRDDWQLLGSLVTGGQLQIVAIEPEEAAAAAE